MTIEATPAPPDPRPLRASVWHRNGDHPDDRVGEEVADPIVGGTYTRLEGAVVRRYARPDRPGDEECPRCWKPWKAHGWIDEGGDGLTVCPGMLVVDLADGTHAVAKVDSGYRDRNDHYVPAGLNLNGRPQYAEVSEGSRGRSAETLEVYMASAALCIRGLLDVLDGGDGGVAPGGDIRHAAEQWLRTMADPAPYETPRRPRVARIAMAMPDELNRDQGDWWWADLSAEGEPPGSHWSAFRGHRVQVDVKFSTSNSREVNDWKGRDEIRAGGHWQILLNRQPMYDGHIGSDPVWSLDRLREKLRWLLNDADHGPLNHTDPRPYREQLLGRRVYYHGTAAVVTDTALERGCVVFTPVGRPHFPRQAHDLDSEPDGTGHDEQDLWDAGEERTALVEIDSPHIWWWRKRPYSADEADERYRPQSVSEEGAKTVVKQKSRWEPLGASLPAGEADGAPEVPRGEQVDEVAAGRAAEAVPVVAEDDDELPGVGADGEPEGDEADRADE